MLGKKKVDKVGAAENTTNRVVEEAMASLPATQKWISIDDLRKAARVIDDGKKRPKR